MLTAKNRPVNKFVPSQARVRHSGCKRGPSSITMSGRPARGTIFRNRREENVANTLLGNIMMRLFAVSLAVAGYIAANAAAEDKVDFAKQIQPILSENCAKCHGEKRASAKLRMHTAAALKEKWDAEKKLIVAGNPEESELYKRIVLPKDDKKRMPKSGEPLAKEKIDLIARWIKE